MSNPRAIISGLRILIWLVQFGAFCVFPFILVPVAPVPACLVAVCMIIGIVCAQHVLARIACRLLNLKRSIRFRKSSRRGSIVIGVTLFALIYPGMRREYVLSATIAAYTSAIRQIVLLDEAFAGGHEGNWPSDLMGIAPIIVSRGETNGTYVVDIRSFDRSSKPLSVVYNPEKTA